MRNVKPRAPMSDLFASKGRAWVADHQLPVNEREMVNACLRHLNSLAGEVKSLDQVIARSVVTS